MSSNKKKTVPPPSRLPSFQVALIFVVILALLGSMLFAGMKPAVKLPFEPGADSAQSQLAAQPLLPLDSSAWYAALDTIRPPKGDTREVVEFFWYGCPHCLTAEKQMAAWKPTLPAGWAVVSVPAPLGRWAEDAKVFFALKSLGAEERLRLPLMEAFQSDPIDSRSDDGLRKLLVAHGVDWRAYKAALASPETAASVAAAGKLFSLTGLTGVPAFILEGYVVNTSLVKSDGELLPFVAEQAHKFAR